MRSAIYFPDTEVANVDTMRSALLMWDQVKVIVPWPDFKPVYLDRDMSEAWELIGDNMCPDLVQQQEAHKSIEQLVRSQRKVDVIYEDWRAGATQQGFESHELWPQKFLPETMQLLQDSHWTSGPLANGDYPFEKQNALVVLSKLTDACAGTTFARITEQFLGYSFVGDADPAIELQQVTVPLTLSTMDATQIPIRKLIDFRKRELSEARGQDYRKMRHRYADAMQEHVENLKGVTSKNQINEIQRQFQEDMSDDLRELESAIGSNNIQRFTAPIVITAVVAAGSILAAHSIPLAIAALAAGGWHRTAIEKAAEALRWQNEFSAKQREILAKHPMAYLYQIRQAL